MFLPMLPSGVFAVENVACAIRFEPHAGADGFSAGTEGFYRLPTSDEKRRYESEQDVGYGECQDDIERLSRDECGQRTFVLL